MATLENLIQNAQPQFDLTENRDQEALYKLAEALLNVPDLTNDELKEAARTENAPLSFRLAAKLVESRRFVQNIDQSLHIGVVFAMWGEHNRLKPKSADNPNGEDSLRVKLEQLDWVTKGSAIRYSLYAVDDGCPHGSGSLARQIALEHRSGENVTVLHLAEALPAAGGPLADLAGVDDSRKGGAVIYGCMKALEDEVDAVIYTDADNSVHLGQIGLLLQPYLDNNTRVVLGNRKHTDAVLVKQESRWGIGIKLLRHMQRMVGKAIFSNDIRDTQAAFKLYEATILRDIIAHPTVFDFSFDTDWILAAIAANEPFEKVPFAFIDSAAESASIVQGPMTTWETLLKGLVKAVRRHGVDHVEEMATILDEEIHSYKDLELLINHLPEQLRDAQDQDFGNPEIMSPEEVRGWIQLRKIEANQEN